MSKWGHHTAPPYVPLPFLLKMSGWVDEGKTKSSRRVEELKGRRGKDKNMREWKGRFYASNLLPIYIFYLFLALGNFS
jgi:hypothetical protein